MKRLLAITLSIIMVFSLCACGNKETEKINCSSCGEGITKDAAFCDHCGVAVNNKGIESENTSSDNSSSTESKTEETIKPSSSTENTNKPSDTSKPSTHTHSYYQKVTAATCSMQGYTVYTCSCGDEYTVTSAALQHSYTKYKYRCDNCGVVDKTHTIEYLREWIKANKTTIDMLGYIFECKTGSKNGNIMYYTYQIEGLEGSIALINQGIYNGDGKVFVFLTDSTYEWSTYDKTVFVKGEINFSTFTKNTKLTYSSYEGDENLKNTVMDCINTDVHDLIEWLVLVLKEYDVGITIKDLGFTSY